ncbi:MAG: nuclear transport factor 2 family protein [Proteobacteria bacterium]|nr:nuclear transport factor 2 family protein [Pseudomonadota bacterium]
MSKYQASKAIVRHYLDAMEGATPETVTDVLKAHTSKDYMWQGVYPFLELHGAGVVAETFWTPLMRALTHMQRRQDIFIGGTNEISGEQWVMSMGNFMGLFDANWLGIRHTRKMANLRYAEFNCVENGRISRTGLFVDIIGLMDQAGSYPLPPSTGAYFNYPGPRTHDGLLFEDAAIEEGEITLALVNEMIDDLRKLNESGCMDCPPEVLESVWSENMIWYGPAGVGATYTIPRYQEQHQLPFRNNLDDKKFIGHVCRFAEGNFACFFGWPNLSNTPLGGWLGLPGGNVNTVMQVVDVYRREGDKLAENWVFIDIPYWLRQQGLDVFGRTQKILNPIPDSITLNSEY